MADNVVVSPPSGPGGATVATDNIGGVMHQRVKLVLGNDGVSDGDVSTTNAMPVTGTVHAQGMPIGASYLRRFGVNDSVGAAHELVDSVGAATPYMPLTAVTVEAVSSSNADNVAGAGALTILVTGLDANFDQKTSTITLTGTTPAVDSTFIRVTKVEVATVGTYGGSNLGTITIRASGGTTFLTIPVGYGQSFSSHFCVPRGYYGAVTGANLSIDSNKTVDVIVRARDHANVTVAPFGPASIVQYYAGVVGSTHYDYEPPILINPYTDVYITAATPTSTAQVSVEYWGYIAPL